MRLRICYNKSYKVGSEEKPEALHYLTDHSSPEVTAFEFSDSQCLTSVCEKLKCVCVCLGGVGVDLFKHQSLTGIFKTSIFFPQIDIFLYFGNVIIHFLHHLLCTVQEMALRKKKNSL